MQSLLMVSPKLYNEFLDPPMSKRMKLGYDMEIKPKVPLTEFEDIRNGEQSQAYHSQREVFFHSTSLA